MVFRLGSSSPVGSDSGQASDACASKAAPSGGVFGEKPNPVRKDRDFPGAFFKGLKGSPDVPATSSVKHEFDATLSFREYAAALPRLLLQSRTPFGAYLGASFKNSACRDGNAPPSATFPLPLPELNLFAASGPRLPLRKWRSLVRRRMLHILVLALNYVREGLKRPPEYLLWRVPNSHQRQVYDRLRNFLFACESQPSWSLRTSSSGPSCRARTFRRLPCVSTVCAKNPPEC